MLKGLAWEKSCYGVNRRQLRSGIVGGFRLRKPRFAMRNSDTTGKEHQAEVENAIGSARSAQQDCM